MTKRSPFMIPGLIIFFLILLNPVAEGSTYEVSGYLKNFFLLIDDSGDTDVEALALWRLRLDYRQSDSVSWELAYELAPQVRGQDNISSSYTATSMKPLPYRAFDLDEKLYPENSGGTGDFILYQNLDRANVAISTSAFDFYLGRQAVAFGSARVINPTNIIAPCTYTTLTKDEPAGVDAARIKIPTGRMGEFDIGYVPGDDFDYKESAAFLRLRSYLHETDVTLITMVFRENYLLGIDLARSIGEYGAWLEAAYTFSHEESEENYARISVGGDYSFTGNLYAYIEYHYNSAGKDSPEDYRDLDGTTAYTDGAVYLTGRHYLAPGFRYQLTPLLIFTGQALLNINDGSVIAAPALEYSLADDITMLFSAYVGISDGPSGSGIPESEFGLYKDMYFVSLNIYF
ncbi:MAG: hypothetical protein VST72_07780 [Nitrospirota bacterium]|nr:hypothetical protein [Nitrospirota bacterium]